MKEDAAAYRKKLVEQIAETDDSLLEKYLDKGDLSQEDLIAGLKHGTIGGGLLPVLCGSPVKNMGIQPLLDMVLMCLPSPVEHAGIVQIKGNGSEDRQRDRAESRLAEEPLAALVFKTIIDPFAGKLSLVRVFSGTLKADSTVYNSSEADKRKNRVPVLHPGKKTGHHAGTFRRARSALSRSSRRRLPAIRYAPRRSRSCLILRSSPTRCMSYAIEPKSRGDEDKVSIGIHKLLDEDPTLRFAFDDQTKEMVLVGHGTGPSRGNAREAQDGSSASM